jgi:hypothetical protein
LHPLEKWKGRLAQLVQSICLTSRGSLVRIQQCPRGGIDTTVSPFYMQYFVYILYSEKLDRYYIGSTGNPEDRLRKHNRSKNGFTSTGKPWKLVYKEIYVTKTKVKMTILRQL